MSHVLVSANPAVIKYIASNHKKFFRMQTDTPKIFISHAWEDKPLVRRLEVTFKAACAEVWVDHEGIRGGDNLPERISEALDWCNTLVLVWSTTASQSRWVKLEWSNAISLEKNIIPCRLDDTKLPAILAHKAYIDFKDIEQGFTLLLQALKLRKPILIPVDESLIRLRSKPATLSEADVRAMFQKYDFYCAEYEWNEAWSNTQGKGIKNKFEVHETGLVIFDHATNLMWQQGGSSKSMTFTDAEAYVHDLNTKHYASFSDWRLPTLEESMSLMTCEEKNGGFHIYPAFDNTQWSIWTVDKSAPGVAWVVDFNFAYCDQLGVDSKSDIRAVR